MQVIAKFLLGIYGGGIDGFAKNSTDAYLLLRGLNAEMRAGLWGESWTDEREER